MTNGTLTDAAEHRSERLHTGYGVIDFVGRRKLWY